ncbi:actin-like ATPase domain-containing protein [Gigaspora margarita]|uniref:Actin-like ATPase domain-containing protein n=2 Tax=Gigaspora margarita TaxID=4874 RepID=A0A8H4B3N4_GIGMA|nr:actin-like ATPase domain-containing protein [Gigaspora margarita]
MSLRDIRIVVGIDFGTTFSGFAYANRVNSEITTNNIWPDHVGQFKTNTALLYNNELSEVKAWGLSALAEKPRKRRPQNSDKSIHVELFKLYLGDISDDKKPILPKNMNYKQAITDYLRELVKDTIDKRWPGVNFFRNVLLVFSVPAEFSEKAKAIMRGCIYNAELIETLDSENLQFTTEPEAAAIYCMEILRECYEFPIGKSFLLVDCGGGTVDLTTRRLLKGNKLGEITERTGGFCGSAYVDKEFIKYIKNIVGSSAIKLLQENHYSQFQYMVQEFCRLVKTIFTGDSEKFRTFELDFSELCPAIKQYIRGNQRDHLEDCDWIIDLDFYAVKAMFDPVISQIINLISYQLHNVNDCAAIYLVGGFSESKYLQTRIRSVFNYVPHILVPKDPLTAVARGAVQYGLDMRTIKTRVLKYSYGVKVAFNWEPGDPPERRTKKGRIFKFHQLATRGTIVEVNQEFSEVFVPFTKKQTTRAYRIYVTRKTSGKYCDEEGMKFLGELRIESPNTSLGVERPVLFSLRFGKMEIDATAIDHTTDQVYKTTFKLELEDSDSSL